MSDKRKEAGETRTTAAAPSTSRAAASISKTTAMWTRRNTSSGEFAALRRKGVSFRGAGK